MPELPEVETYRRDLDKALPGRVFLGARCDWPRQLPVNSPEELDARIRGQAVRHVARHGKVLAIALADDWLLVHLGMSGRLSCVARTEPVNAHAHVVFDLDDGSELRFHDPRKFGRIRLVADLDAALGGLGPDALGAQINEAAFVQRLRARNRQLKPLLLDQAFIAGIGNIYADEALWAAKLHPLTAANRLTKREAATLYEEIRGVLARSVEARGTTFTPAGYRDFWGEPGGMVTELQVFRRTREPCGRCGTPIARLVVGGRSTHICPKCQRRRPCF